MNVFLSWLEEVNAALGAFVWGLPMMALLIGSGVWFTLRSGFFQITHARWIARETVCNLFRRQPAPARDQHAISQFQAFSTALAATIGVGNIAGVATAISSGGPGAVFWMWVAAFLGMMTNYAENVLGVYFRKRSASGEWVGGAMYYIEEGLRGRRFLRHLAEPLARLFSIFCVLASFGMGNMSQVNTIAVSLDDAFAVPPAVTGAVLAVLTGMVVLGGIKRIAKVTEKVVPLMAVGYIFATAAVLVVNRAQIPAVFGGIFRAAFSSEAVLGGAAGGAVRSAVSWGLKRGVFSNEAGLGSSVMVHAAADCREPVVQGMWGAFEVFFDTILMCTLTAFTILSSGVIGAVDAAGRPVEGASLVALAFSDTFHEAAGAVLAVSVTLFAFATVLGWSYYGEQAVAYLAGKKAGRIYKIIYAAAAFAGSTLSLGLVWDLSDTFNALMAIPNLVAVLALSSTVFALTRNFLARKRGAQVQPMLSAYADMQKQQEEALAREQHVR